MQRFFSLLFLLVSLGLAYWVYAWPRAPKPSVELVSHRAMYEVSLKNLKTSGNLAGLKGLMVYEWRKGCQTYLTTTRSTLTYAYTDGQGRSVNTDTISEEAANGTYLNFGTRRESGGLLDTQIKGIANKKEAVFSLPEQTVVSLPEGTYFPMQHTVETYKRAQAGETQFTARLFDGSEEKKGPMLVNTLIGKSKLLDAPDPDLHIDSNLITKKAQSYRFSFFEDTADDSLPAYEMEVTAQANGIVRSLFIDYEDFSIQQTLKALQKLDDLPCTPKQ